MTLKEYKDELTEIFRCNTTRGFADWRQCGNLAYNVEDFLDRAAKVLLRAVSYTHLTLPTMTLV